MTTVGVRELKNHLSEYLARVKRGERITVTERGKEIAVIRPAAEVEDDLRRRFMQLVAEGRATWDGGKPQFPERRVRISGKPISETVIEDRGEIEAASPWPQQEPSRGRYPVTKAGVRELKNHLSAYLARVKRGERITVTERGRQIATIEPYSEIEDGLHTRLMRLVDEGIASWRGGKPCLPEPLVVPGKPLSEIVIEDRG